jgi:hypothetical protein
MMADKKQTTQELIAVLWAEYKSEIVGKTTLFLHTSKISMRLSAAVATRP